MTNSTNTQQRLFDLPPSFQYKNDGGSMGDTECQTQSTTVQQLALWSDRDIAALSVPPRIPIRLPSYLIGFRARLKKIYKTSAWADDAQAFTAETTSDVVWIPRDAFVAHEAWLNWISEQRQRLEALVKKIGYTQALEDGPYRVYLEYRPCDKFPHYRLLWRELFWGRADIYIDTDGYGADIHTSSSLPYVQRKLAAYLHDIGCRPDNARLVPHDIPLDDDYIGDVLFDEDEDTDTREYRLFRVNIEKEKSRLHKQKLNQKNREKEFA